MPSTKQIVIIGDGAAGKTCLLHCYSNESFLEDYVPTIYDKEVFAIMIDNVEHTVKIIDTAGQEGYDKLRKMCYKDADAFILCYDVSNRDSFKNIQSMWLPEIQKTCESRWPVPIVLVATKTDLRKIARPELITTEEGKLLSRQIFANSFVECSAKENHHIQQAIHEGIRAAVKGPIIIEDETISQRSCCQCCLS